MINFLSNKSFAVSLVIALAITVAFAFAFHAPEQLVGTAAVLALFSAMADSAIGSRQHPMRKAIDSREETERDSKWLE